MVLENHFQYFWWYQDKSCHGFAWIQKSCHSLRVYDTSIKVISSSYKKFELVLDCESLHDFEIKLNCFQFHSRVTPDSHRDRLDAIIYEILWCGDTALLISVTCCFVCQQLNQLKVKHEILTEHQSCIMEGSQLRYIITSPDRNNWNTETVGVDCDQV